MQCKGDAERQGRHRVAEVVDQVGEQRDATACDEHGDLRQRRQRENTQGDGDGANSLPRALDLVVDQAVRVTVLAVLAVRVSVAVAAGTIVNGGRSDWLGKSKRREVAMSPTVGVAVHALAVAVHARLQGLGH
jgi:hypothetical protein